MALLGGRGLDRSLITGFDEWTSAHETFIPDELVAGLAERHPDRFVPLRRHRRASKGRRRCAS